MWAMAHITGLVAVLSLGQAAPGGRSTGWLWDYQDGLQLELIEGDLAGAAAAYRRVAVSRAPRLYVERARYRLADALARLDRAPEARELLRRLQDELHESAALRAVVGRRLARLTADSQRQVDYWIEQLRDALRGQDTDRLSEAAATLARWDGPDGAGALVNAYSELAPDDPARTILLGHLADSQWPAAVPFFRRALDEQAPAVVAAAARSIGVIGDAESAGRLVELLAHSDPPVRTAAARSLGQLRHLAATDRILAVARDDPNDKARTVAIDVLRCFASVRALRGLADLSVEEKPHECPHTFSVWYRQACAETVEPQYDFADPDRDTRTAPRIGVVVSAMTHHGPTSREKLFQPYTAQIRKAWTLAQAGFDVCLLAEPEVLEDPAAAALAELFEPDVNIYQLGQWPACDVVLMDQLLHLPAALVRTIRALGEAGGRVLICGAVGGGWCGDRVTWQQVVGVRRLHAGYFSREAIGLQWHDPPNAVEPGNVRPAAWVTRRCGSFFARDTLRGRVLAEFDSPKLWAVKSHDLGAGKVFCVNWDVGLNVAGAHDEDELLGRWIDDLVGKNRDWPAPRYNIMRHRRWGDLAAAKQCVDAAGLAALSPAERLETLAQLYRIYQLENNGMAGQQACRRWFERFDETDAGQTELARLERSPDRVQLALAVGTRYIWWRDVPGWSIPRGGIPLWLAGPAELPARVRLRVTPPPGAAGRVRFIPTGARIEAVADGSAVQYHPGSDGVCEVAYNMSRPHNTAIEVELSMTEWTARVRVERGTP